MPVGKLRSDSCSCEHIEGTVGTEKIRIVAAMDLLDYPVTDRFQFIDGTYDKVQPHLHNLILLAWAVWSYF